MQSRWVTCSKVSVFGKRYCGRSGTDAVCAEKSAFVFVFRHRWEACKLTVEQRQRSSRRIYECYFCLWKPWHVEQSWIS